MACGSCTAREDQTGEDQAATSWPAILQEPALTVETAEATATQVDSAGVGGSVSITWGTAILGSVLVLLALWIILTTLEG